MRGNRLLRVLKFVAIGLLRLPLPVVLLVAIPVSVGFFSADSLHWAWPGSQAARLAG